MRVPLEKLADVWPEEVRRELADVDPEASELLIPMELIEPALKSGKVLFSWGDLAGWLQPPLPRTPSRSATDILVDLPLKILAPLFMAQHRAAQAAAKADVGQNIPDLFYSNTSPANSDPRIAAPNLPPPSVAPTAMPASTPAPPISMPRLVPSVASPLPPAIPRPTPAPASATPDADRAPSSPTLDQIVGPDQRRHGPRDIVNHVARIPGVTGCLLAMSDGLLVTASLPETVKAEMVAAFLPQIFGRMGQYTRELGLGQLQSLALTVDGGCWHVFKQPNIYFAVSGKPGEAMPLNLLAQIAAELGKQQV
jgi:hypothetical protein